MHFLCYRGKKGGLAPVYTDAIEKTCQDHGESSLKVPCIMCESGQRFRTLHFSRLVRWKRFSETFRILKSVSLV